jgi:hypothetical protein
MAAGVRVCVCLLSLLLVTNAQSPMCPFGRTLSYCYNQCPLVCGMMAEDCNAMCLSGCFCSADLYQFGDLCLQEESCPDIDIDFEDIPVRDKCSDFEDCDECISSDPDCQWCPYEPVHPP